MRHESDSSDRLRSLRVRDSRSASIAPDDSALTGHDDRRGGDGDDSLDGGKGIDRCDGGPAIDEALACEELVSVP